MGANYILTAAFIAMEQRHIRSFRKMIRNYFHDHMIFSVLQKMKAAYFEKVLSSFHKRNNEGVIWRSKLWEHLYFFILKIDMKLPNANRQVEFYACAGLYDYSLISKIWKITITKLSCGFTLVYVKKNAT